MPAKKKHKILTEQAKRKLKNIPQETEAFEEVVKTLRSMKKKDR